MLSGGTQRRILLYYHSELMKILNITFPRVGIEPTTCHVYNRTLCPTPRLASSIYANILFIITIKVQETDEQ